MEQMVLTPEVRQILMEIMQAETLEEVRTLAGRVVELLQVEQDRAQVQVDQLREEVRRLSHL
jgi:hypothetical protein